jgi:branched-chain amino acid transport system substrate-binding protein
MKKSRGLVLAALLSVVALVGAACGGDGGDGNGTAAPDDCTWVIGSMGALSGDAAAIGQPIRDGIQYAVDQVNEQGDLACQLELRAEDSQGDPEQAPQLATSLVEDEELVAVVGPYFSGETLASGDIFNDAGVAFLCPSCTNETIDDQGWDTFFRAVADDAIQGDQAAVYIQEALQPTTVAIVHDNQDYSKGLADRVQEGLGDLAEGPFIITPGESDFSQAVTQVKNSGADVVFYGGYVPEAGPLARQLQEAGVDAQFLSDDGAKDNAFGELAGPAAEGAQVTCPCADPAEVEGGEEFVSGMEEEFGEPPGTFAAEGYDSVNLVAEALKEFDADASVEDIRAGIVEYLDGVEGYAGVVKEYTFGDNGTVEVGPEGIYVYEWSSADENFVVLGAVDELTGG